MAKALVHELDEVCAARVPADYFFLPGAEEVSPGHFLERPLEWDWALLRERLALPIGTVTSTPDVDFEAFRRRRDDGGLPFTIRPVMICDAMAAYPESDLVILLHVPDEVRQRRIVERDRRWGTGVADRWQHLEMTWQNAFNSLNPHLVLDGTVPLATTAGQLGQRIRGALAWRESFLREGEDP
jgi:hypothetical protein